MVNEVLLVSMTRIGREKKTRVMKGRVESVEQVEEREVERDFRQD